MDRATEERERERWGAGPRPIKRPDGIWHCPITLFHRHPAPMALILALSCDLVHFRQLKKQNKEIKIGNRRRAEKAASWFSRLVTLDETFDRCVRTVQTTFASISAGLPFARTRRGLL